MWVVWGGPPGKAVRRGPSPPPGLAVAAAQVLTDAAPRLGAALECSHFAFFCDKMARMLVPRYLDCVYRLKRCVPRCHGP